MLIGAAEGSPPAQPSRVGTVDPRLVYFRLPGSTRDELLANFASRLAAQGAVRDAGELTSRLVKRERDGCTGVGRGIAIPHCRIDGLSDEVVAFASTAQPVEFGALDGVPVDLVFLVVSPTQAAAAHLQAVARVSWLLRLPGIAEALRAASSNDELVEVLRRAETGLAGPA